MLQTGFLEQLYQQVVLEVVGAMATYLEQLVMKAAFNQVCTINFVPCTQRTLYLIIIAWRSPIGQRSAVSPWLPVFTDPLASQGQVC